MGLVKLVFAVWLVVLPLGSAAQEAEQPSGTIEVTGGASQDGAIALRIRDILSELDGFEEVMVDVSAGIVRFEGTTLDSANVTRLNEIASRIEGVVAIENDVAESTDVVRRLNPAVERFQARFYQLLAFTPLLLVAALAFLLVVLIGVGIARLRQPWDRIAPNAFIADILRILIRLAFVIGGIVIALDILNATALLSTILGAAGIIGLAIGFAVRDTVENFIASVMLSIRQPFRPNDTVEIEGDIGKVIRLTSRATILLSFDGNHIRIPNSTVFKSRIVNYSRNDERRFVIDLGVAYGTDLTRAQAIALGVVEELPFVLKQPAPSVWIEELGDSAIVVKVAGWILQHETSFLKARSEAWRLCMAAFDEAGVVMPETTLRLVGVGEGLTPVEAPPAQTPTAQEPSAAAQAEVVNVDAVEEQQLEAIVETERAATKRTDLLVKGAEEE